MEKTIIKWKSYSLKTSINFITSVNRRRKTMREEENYQYEIARKEASLQTSERLEDGVIVQQLSQFIKHR